MLIIYHTFYIYFIITGEVCTIMVDKAELIEAGYEIALEKNIDLPTCSQMQLQTNISDERSEEWSDESTKFILDKYSNYLELVGPMKKFKNKKTMWLQIAQDLSIDLSITKTFIQCENRYKTILKRKRVCNKNNSTSGSKRIKVHFEEEINKIASIDDSIEPEVLQSANKVVLNVKNSNVPEASNVKKNERANLVNTLLLIHKEREAKKQERHEEKMKLLQSLFEKEKSGNT